MKGITLDELKVKIYGPLGNPKRDAIEQEIKMELLKEEIKRLRKERKLTQEQLGKLGRK